MREVKLFCDYCKKATMMNPIIVTNNYDCGRENREKHFCDRHCMIEWHKENPDEKGREAR